MQTDKHPCPTCGQDLDTSGLFIDLNSNTVCAGIIQTKVRPTVAELLYTLLKHSPGIISRAQIMDSIYAAQSDAPLDHVVSVMIYSARRALRGTGWHIENRFKVGYRLVPDEMAA